MPKAKTKRREMMKNKKRGRKRVLMQRTTKVQEVEEVVCREYEKFS